MKRSLLILFAAAFLSHGGFSAAEPAPSAGMIGVNAKFGDFGDYLQELIEIVDSQWNMSANRAAVQPPKGSKVVVRFTLNSSGDVSKAEALDTTAGKLAVEMCLRAIQDRQPYRPWTKDMIAALGDEQELTFQFVYRAGSPVLVRSLRPEPVATPPADSISAEDRAAFESIAVELGMRTNELIRRRGQPTRRSRTVSEHGTIEVLFYPGATFTFKNGELTSWTEHL